jgi:hypothetical protein
VRNPEKEDAPTAGMSEAQKTGVFLVTAADEDSAVLKDVADGQVHALSSNPGVSHHELIEGTVAPDPPMNVSWQLVDISGRREPTIVESDQSPTAQSKEIAAGQPVGELTREERAGDGEWHVLTVPEDGTEQAVTDVLEDTEGLLSRAGRLGISRIEVRSMPGVVSVRYLP